MIFLTIALLLAAPALPASAGRVFVSNEDEGTISVIDTAVDRVVSTIAVGKRPRGLRLGPDGRLYVAVSGSAKAGPGVDESRLPPPDRRADGVAVVDLAKGKVVRILTSGTDPETFDLSKDGKRVYVANEDAGLLSVLDTASGEIRAQVPVGEEPEGVAVAPDGTVYVTSEAAGEVDVIDERTLAVVARVKTAERPRGIVFSRDGKRAFVTCEKGGAVTVVDVAKRAAAGTVRLPDGARPMGAALSSDGGQVFVTTGRGGTIGVLDAAKASLLRVIPAVGARPWGIAVAAKVGKLYTANGPSNDVSVVEAASGRLLARVPVGRSPWGVAVEP